MNRSARSVLTAVLVAALLGTASIASPERAAAADPRLGLLGQPATVPLGGTATLTLDVPADQLPAGREVTLRVRLYNRVTSLEAFEETNAGDLPGRLDVDRWPLAELPRAADGSVSVTFGIGNNHPLEHAVATSQAGAYPLEIALETGDETLTAFVTWLVVVAADAPPVEEPLRVAMLWSITSDPVRGVDGATSGPVLDDLAPGGRLDGISTLLASAGSMPLTLAIAPETLEGWDALANIDPAYAPAVERVEAAAARSSAQLLLEPYVPIDLVALEAAGLGGQLPDQLVTGSDASERLAVRPQPGTAFPDPVNGAVLARLRQLLVDRVVVRGDQVETEATTLLRPFGLAAGIGTMRAVATTTVVDRQLSGSDPRALRVQRALTALSILALDDPETARGVVLAPPARWSPDVELYTAFLAAFREHPLLRPVTVDALFAQVDAETDDGRTVVRDLEPAEPGSLGVTGAQYTAAAQALTSLRSSIPPDSPTLAQGERALLLALGRAQPEAASAGLAVIDGAVEQLNAGVGTTRKRVTLTSRRADVPISFRNDTGMPVRVRVHLDSSKLLFPKGDDIEIELPEGVGTERFTVEARTSGTFTMTVTLTTGDGNMTIGAPTRITVRSAVFSGVGAAITIGALVFLALWWGNHFRRTRRARAKLGPS